MFRSWPVTVCLAVAYFATGYAGLMLPAVGSTITLLWLPTGIAVAALRRWGFGCWPGVLIGALAVNLAVGSPFTLSVGIAVGNTLGPLLTTWVLVRAGFSMDLKRPRDILLLSGAAGAGMAVTASVGVVCLLRAGLLPSEYASAWLIWWAGDVTGVITAAPLVLVPTRATVRGLWVRRTEFACWAVLLVLAIAVVFLLNGTTAPALSVAFLPFPLLVWAAIRFGPIGTSLGVIVLSFGAALGTSAGYGPFARPLPTDSVLSLGLFMLTCIAVGWLVAALTVSQAEATGARRVLEQALDEVAFGVLVAGVDRRITHVNAGFTRLTGYAEGELVGGSCDLLQGSETDPATVARLKAALRDGRGFEGDILNYRKDGTAFWNALLITPIHNEVGEWVGFLGIQRDVTDLKREQLAHTLSEERFRAIIELEPECVKITAPDGRLLEMNSAGLAMIEADSLDQVRGNPIDSLIHPSDRPAFHALNRRVIQLGESGTCEFAITGLKGTHRHLETHAVPYRDERHEVVGVLAVTRDITRQKQVTDELEQTVATLKLFVDTVPAMIAFIDAEERYQLVNARFADFFSLTADQILGRTVRDLHSPQAYQVIAPHIRAVLRGEAVHYQSSLPQPDGRRFWFEARYIPRTATDGTVSGYYVMVFDVSDRMRAEEELRASRDRLDFLVASSPAVIYTSNPSGDFAATFLSANVRGVTGYKPEDFIRDPQFWMDRVHPQDLPGILEGLQALTANGRHSYEYRFRTSSGAYRWMRDDMVLNRDSDGNPVEVIGSWLDVTDRKRAEEELRVSESRLDSFFTASPVGMAIYDTDCRWTHVNPTLAAMNGLPVEAHIGHRPSDLLSSDLAAGIEVGLRRILETGTPDINREVSGTTPARSGMTRYGLSTQAPIFDADGRIAGVGVIVVETTELKRAEAALRASEERYRLLFEANPHPMWVYDRETLRFLAVNEAAVRHYGYSRDEFLAMTIKDIRPADDVARRLENVRNLGTGIDLAGVWRHRKKDGTVIEVEISSHVLTFDGRAAEVVLAHDVTAQKRAERALVDNEARLRLALAAANQGLFDVNLVTGECVVSPEYATMLGFDPAEFRETKAAWVERLHPDDRERVIRADEDYLAGRRSEYRVEFRQRTRSGDWKWVFSIGAVVAWTPDGRPLRMLGTHTDITDRKRAEDEVRQARDTAESALSELRGASARAEQFYQLCQAAGQGIGISRLDGTLTYLNPAFRRMLHIPDGDDISRTAFWDLVPSENHQFLTETVLTRTRETGSWTGEFDLLTRTGRRVPIINTVVLLRDPEGTVVGYTNIATDITERKRVETALRESEERLRIFVENAPAGVAMLDREMRYLSYSRRWLVDYGLGEQNLLGRSHYDVFTDIPDRWKEIHRRCLTGVSERCEQDRFERVDGETDYLRWEIQPWTDATGAVGGLVFFTESITERVNTELRLRAALRDKEALLKEVHHRVKNNLQIITSLLNLQAETVREPAVLGLLRESQTRVRAMALVHETLYRSGDFGRIDLAGYLTSICNYLARSYGIDTTRVQMAVEVTDTTLDLDRAVPCGLIINELVSNALKHAFPDGRAGRVAVRLGADADLYYHLSVSDDGVGLPASLDWHRLPSLGLQLVSDLVLQLDGHLTVLQGPGAEYRIRFPLSPPRPDSAHEPHADSRGRG